MNFIKKIFDKKSDDLVHAQFQKFSKGEFINRALIRVKNSKGKYSIVTSAEFANGLVRLVAEKLGSGKTNVTGAIVSTSDLKEKLDFKEIKQFQGVKRYLIDKEMSGEEIIQLLEEFPKTFFALTFNADEKTKLKIKPKAPTSGKPGKAKEGPKADFCTLKTIDKEIAQDFIFEKSDFKLAEINHTYFVEQIIPPKGEKDYSKIREMAKRKGKIVRKAIIDEQDMSQEFGLEA